MGRGLEGRVVLTRLLSQVLIGAALFFGLWVAPSNAQTSSIKVSNLPFASIPFSGSELLYVIQGGVAKSTNLSELFANSTLGRVGDTGWWINYPTTGTAAYAVRVTDKLLLGPAA